MRNVKILTDSCADLPVSLLEKYEIDYMKMTTLLDGRESPASLSWSHQDAHQLYETMREGKRITTAQVPAEEFRRVFTRYLQEGFDIVYIACSSRQSGSVQTGRMIAKKLLGEYPGASIFCMDSLNASMGEGLLAIEAAKMAAAGKPAGEITDAILSVRKNVHQYATVHTLDYLKRAGRVSASSAFLGNLMGVKPILISDRDGAQTAYKKVRGRQHSLQEIVSLLRENIIHPEDQTVYVAHADCSPEEVETVVRLIQSEIPCRDICVGYIGPIIGASVGPDCIAVWGFGRPVTFCAEES
ncbi:MAG: DegV family protein [Candidatus Heritagella sp.]